MNHETIDIPQADVLWDVARVPEAIARGKSLPDEIGVYIGTKVARQGLYYTQAARILGFVKPCKPGEPVELTPFGRAFAYYNQADQRTALRRMLLQREPTRSVVVAMRTGDGLRRAEIAAVLQSLAPLAQSTALRRSATVAAWLCATGLARWERGRLAYCGPNVPVEPAIRRQHAA
ncbi:hypothetical protein K2Z83_25110 [Oscillochloris sp. ZM17-4]|uniref:DUF7226 domain-containing protein n=1 Tax=Oscillochloris sp. ZM17-4 TaxID=2866714 RepID=UPI001C7346CB|nr:hypothetical protein [Oscillochloris sp. ZM17-4]MBX0330941.1 hypothetical protein [Oscillochloris sp. ZM17-4]